MLETILVLCNTFFSSFICCSLVFYVSFFILWVYRRLFFAFVCWILGVIFCYLAFLWLFWLFPFFSFIFYFFHHFPDVWFCAFRFCWVWLTVHLTYCSLLRIPRPARHPAAQVRPSPKYIQIAILEPKNRWLVEPSSGTVSITAPPLAWQNVCFIHSSRPPTIYVLISFNDWLFTATLTDRFLSWWGAEVGRCTPCFVV